MGWTRRLLNVFRAERLSRELDRELEFHVAERADDLRARGLTAAEAEREARRRLGHPVLLKERTRESDVLVWLDTVRADVRYAVRSLVSSPGFALVAILSLGLGIGANTAIFGLLDAVVLRTLPVQRPEELVQLKLLDGGQVWPNPLWEALRDRQEVFSAVAAYSDEEFDLSQGGVARPVRGSYVSGDFFRMLGVRPEAGRLLSASDDHRGCPAVAVLGAGFVDSEYGEAAAAIGRSITLTGKPFEIVGVADRAFHGVTVGRSAQVYVPLCAEAVIAGPRSGLDQRARWFLQVLARPKRGLTSGEINGHLAAIAPAALEATLPEQYTAEHRTNYLGGTFTTEPAAGGFSDLRAQYSRALLVLMGLVGVVLLIACANVASLLLARATARQREMAVRLAIGAGRARIIRQLLTESLLLAAISSVVGVLFAVWCSRGLVALLSTSGNPVFLDLPLDLRLLGFTVLVAAAAALGFGLAPAWQSSHENPQHVLRAGGRGIIGTPARLSGRKLVVIGQIALSLVTLVAAGLLVGTFRTLWTGSPGFDRDRVLLVTADLPHEDDTLERQRAVYGPMLERIRALPGVAAASIAQLTPVGGARWNDLIFVEGFTAGSEMDRLSHVNEVGDAYFATLGTRLLAGREFDASDVAGAPRTAVVNEAFATYYFGTRNVVGREFRLGAEDAAPYRIVGVVENAKYQSLREEPQRIGYTAWTQATERAFVISFHVRLHGDERTVREAVVAVAETLDPALALRFTLLERQIADSLSRERLLATLSAAFGGLALLLAVIGLYGVMAYNVNRRRNEIGIRIALGSARGRVIRMVLREGSALIAAGIVIGTALALAGSRLVTSFLYGVLPNDPATLAASALLLGGAAFGACSLPAWRASRVEPMTALREE